MKEKFQITNRKITIMNILNTMISPEAEKTNSVTQNTVACAKAKKNNQRKKRELEPETQKGRKIQSVFESLYLTQVSVSIWLGPPTRTIPKSVVITSTRMAGVGISNKI